MLTRARGWQHACNEPSNECTHTNSFCSCRQGVRSEARYIRSTDTNQTDVEGIIENMILVATFGVDPCPRLDEHLTVQLLL